MSNNLGRVLVTAGQNQKEVTINDSDGVLDAALTDPVTYTITSSNARTLTSAELAEAQFLVIDEAGATAATVLTLPADARGTFTLRNDMTFDVTCEISGQPLASPVVAAGDAVLLSSDGVNVRTADSTAIGPVEAFIFFPVEGHINPTAAGFAAVLATVATAANQPDVTSLDFDQSTAEHAQLRHVFEDADLLGNVSFQFLWSHAAAASFGVAWHAKAVAVSNDGPLGVNFGTARKIEDAGGTTDDHYLSERTGFVQVATPADLDLVIFDLFRDPTVTFDDLDADARLQGVLLHYWKNQPLDPDWASVSLLAGFDGEDAATDQDDESDNALAATYNGNAAVDTAFTKFSRGAAIFDGTGDNVTFPDDVDFDMGTGDFTLEGWFRWSADAQSGALIAHYNVTGNQRSYLLERDQSAGTLRVLFSTDGTNFFIDINATWAPTVGVYHFIALDFDGTIYRLYVDGVVLGTSTTLRTLHNSTSVFSIGGRGDATVLFTGNADEVRVTKGVARYAGAFTPPTAPFPRG